MNYLSTLPQHAVEHVIEFKPDARVIKLPPYNLAPKHLVFVKETIDMLLSKGFIQRSVSPYAVPITIADKDGGKAFRFCVDYRAINAQTVTDATPPPNIQILFDQLRGATIFSKIDLRTAYWQVKIRTEDRKKTAFVCRYGHFEWLVMPFGLKNAPATFVRLMDEIFGDYLDTFIIVYLDDIVVYSKTLAQHVKHLELVFKRLREHRLYAKLDKCAFMQREIKFLGHLVSADGISVNPDKVKAISDWPVPKTVKDVRAFLGASGYYRKFILNYSKVASSLTELLKDEQPFKWQEEQSTAFNKLKNALSTAPVLQIPDTAIPFKVTTDACSHAVGAVLSQNFGHGDQPVAYLSKKLTGTEQNWPAHEQEMFAIVLACKHWKYLLLGSQFDVYTDSMAMKTMMTQKNLSKKQMRWVMELQEYLPFNIIHVSGKKNIVADALSRNAYHSVATIQQLQPITTESDLDEVMGEHDHSNHTTASNDIENDSDATIIDKIREAYTHDAACSRIIRERNQNYRFDHELIYANNRLLVPNDINIKQHILKQCHDYELAGHIGIQKTSELVKRYFYWYNMDIDIKEYVLSCPKCQMNKSSNQRPMGLLQSIEVPSKRWQVVTVDFILRLPETISTPSYNMIAVFVDKYSKMVHLAPCNMKMTAPAFASLFINNIIRLHGVPQRIISDRDVRFDNNFWRSFTKQLNIELAMSTAYHPQTDGQTERANRTLQEMLRHYVYDNHKSWNMKLPLCEFAINNSISLSTGHTPFYLMYGEHPLVPIVQHDEEASSVPAAVDAVDKLKTVLDEAKSKMEAAQRRQAQYANSSRRHAEFEVGDLVLIRTANYMQRMMNELGSQVAAKLLQRYIGPFPITHKYSSLVYRVRLPQQWSQIHPVFHISNLVPYRKSSTFTDRDELPRDGTPVIRQAMKGDMVKHIIGRKYFGYSELDGHEYKYKVLWKDGGVGSAQWVHPNAIKVNGRQNPLITKYNNDHPFDDILDPAPGSKETLDTSSATPSTIHSSSTDISTRSNILPGRNIPKKSQYVSTRSSTRKKR